MDITFKSLSDVSIDTVLDTFQRAFCDYAVNFDRDQISDMLIRRGYCPELSFAAFHNGEIVAFTLNGAGYYNGVMTCYDCGTGTVHDFRGQKLAGKLFLHSIPMLREAGIKQYILEVLKENAPAISVYRNNGFEITAYYDCFNQQIKQLKLSTPLSIEIEIHDITPDEVSAMQAFCDFIPSWQNSVESIKRGAAGLVMKGAYHNGEPIGHCVFDPKTSDIAQIAVAPTYRRRGVATSLLSATVATALSPTVKILNVDAGCTSLHSFIDAVNINKGLSQFAMRRLVS